MGFCWVKALLSLCPQFVVTSHNGEKLYEDNQTMLSHIQTTLRPSCINRGQALPNRHLTIFLYLTYSVLVFYYHIHICTHTYTLTALSCGSKFVTTYDLWFMSTAPIDDPLLQNLCKRHVYNFHMSETSGTLPTDNLFSRQTKSHSTTWTTTKLGDTERNQFCVI